MSSFFYRILVIVAILLFLGEQSLLLGVIFAGSTAFAWLVAPGAKIGNYLCNSPRSAACGCRAVTIGALVPSRQLVPARSPCRCRCARRPGCGLVAEEGIVRAGADGFVVSVVATPGTWVKPGDVLVETTDLELLTEVKVLEGRVPRARCSLPRADRRAIA